MIAGTHIAFASTLYLSGAALFEYDTDLVGWALAAGASLLPDVDLPASKLGRVLFWLSTRLEKHFGHRTLMHSFIALIVLALLASPLLLIKALYFWCARVATGLICGSICLTCVAPTCCGPRPFEW